MSFTLGSTTFSGRHGKVMPTPFNAPAVRTSFAGARGVIELQEPIKDRTLAIPYLVSASSVANLQTALDTLHIQASQLSGILTVDSVAYQNCKFVGFAPQGQIFNDASSTNWFQRGVCVFHQLNYYAVTS